MSRYNKMFIVCVLATIIVPIQWVNTDEICSRQAEKINAALKTCRKDFDSDAHDDILSQIASATVTVEALKNYSATNCAKNDEVTDCVIKQKATLIMDSCKDDLQYNYAIFALNDVIQLDLFVCAKNNGALLLEPVIPNDGIACIYHNEIFNKCVQENESPADLPDICTNIDARIKCLHTAKDCANRNATQSFRNLFNLYKEKIVC